MRLPAPPAIFYYSLHERLGGLLRDQRIVTFCGVGLRAYIGARILMQNGFREVYKLSGG